MAYIPPMRSPFLASHYVLASLPLLGLLALLLGIYGTEEQAMWAFRLQKEAYPLLQKTMRLISNWGNPAMYVAYLALLVQAFRTGDARPRRFVFAYIAAQVIICFGLLTLTKMALGRPRPEAFTAIHQMLTLDPYFHSLPSGHTAEMTGSCLALALWVGRPRWSLILGLGIALMGFSRMFLFQHYPTDVFFGWMFGSVSGFAAYSFGTGKDGYHRHG